MNSCLDVAVIDDTEIFAGLEEEWDELYCDSALSTPFQSWAWLYSWWESYGEGYKLRLVTIRDGDRLVGVIPLMLQRRWGFYTLHFVGRDDQLDLLARKGWETEVCRAGVRTLRQMDSWHVVRLRELSPAATAWGLFRQWNGPRTHSQTGCYLNIEVKSWDDLLMSIKKSQRSNARGALRRAEEDGVSCVLAQPGEAEVAARRLVALHRELWQGRVIVPDRLTKKFEGFIMAAARRMTERGLGGISEFWRHGNVIISCLFIIGDEFTDAYLVGASQEAVQRYQWSSLFIWSGMNIAHNRNNAYLCLDSGVEPYKQRWAPIEVPYYMITLGRGRVLLSLYLFSLRLYTTYRSLRRRVITYFTTM